MIAAAVRAGGSLARAQLTLRLFDQQSSSSSSS
jgi:hypothetical protein